MLTRQWDTGNYLPTDTVRLLRRINLQQNRFWKPQNLAMWTTISHLQSLLFLLHICTVSGINKAYQLITSSHSTKSGDPWTQRAAFAPYFFSVVFHTLSALKWLPSVHKPVHQTKQSSALTRPAGKHRPRRKTVFHTLNTRRSNTTAFF